MCSKGLYRIWLGLSNISERKMNMNPGVFTIRSQRAFPYIIFLLGVCTMMVFAPIGSLRAEEREPPSSKLTAWADID